MAEARVPCAVDGCARTIGADVYRRKFQHEIGEWICSAHWKRVSREDKRAYGRLRRQIAKYVKDELPPPPELLVREDRIWHALKRRAGRMGTIADEF